MKTLIVVLLAILVAIPWLREKTVAAGLEAEVATLRLQGGELDSLQRERERLRALQLAPEELARLQRTAAEHRETTRELASRDRLVPQALALGEWLPPVRWKNLGTGAPAATVETALWAAAGGDVAVLKGMLQIDDIVRASADELLAQLPANARVTYADAEQLIAAFTIKAIPLGDAQVVWQHQPARDEAVVCVFVKNPEAPAASSTNTTPRNDANSPPMGASSSQTRSAYLSLRRGDDGWRLVVPPSAVDRIAKELGLRTASH